MRRQVTRLACALLYKPNPDHIHNPTFAFLLTAGRNSVWVCGITVSARRDTAVTSIRAIAPTYSLEVVVLVRYVFFVFLGLRVFAVVVYGRTRRADIRGSRFLCERSNVNAPVGKNRPAVSLQCHAELTLFCVRSRSMCKTSYHNSCLTFEDTQRMPARNTHISVSQHKHPYYRQTTDNLVLLSLRLIHLTSLDTNTWH